MAPATRLQVNPELRVDYNVRRIVGSRNNPIVIDDGPAVTAPAHPRRRTQPTPAALPHDTRAARIKAGAVAKPQPLPKRTKKAAPGSKQNEESTKQECAICVYEKPLETFFKVPADTKTCDHLKTICATCIQNMLKNKVTDRELAVSELTCPFPNCDHALDLPILKLVVSKGTYDHYDQALLKHFLSVDQSYFSCLSAKCGKQFSIEDCSNQDPPNRNMKAATKQKIACPYCDYEVCLTCNRPWKLHHSRDCSKIKEAEEKETEKTLKAIGAKPCPKCGINIEKDYGCDHMNCKQCNHHFCWQCLVPYNGKVQHEKNCPHARVNAAADPRNWVPDNVDLNQLNDMIERRANLLAGQHVLHFAPPAIPFGFAPPAAQGPGFGNFMGNLFGWGGNDAPAVQPPLAAAQALALNPPPPQQAPDPPAPEVQVPEAHQPARRHGAMQAARPERRRLPPRLPRR